MNLRKLLHRAPDPTTVAEATTEEWPAPSGNHLYDLMPDDFSRPPTVRIPSQLEQLGGWLESLSPARRQILAESVSSNGFPWWVQKWEEREGGWPVFKAICEEAFEAIDAGRPAALRLLEINDNLDRTER